MNKIIKRILIGILVVIFFPIFFLYTLGSAIIEIYNLQNENKCK